jgi:hypothetical protein
LNQLVKLGIRGFVNIVGLVHEPVGRVVIAKLEEDKNDTVLFAQLEHRLVGVEGGVLRFHPHRVRGEPVGEEDDDAVRVGSQVGLRE